MHSICEKNLSGFNISKISDVMVTVKNLPTEKLIAIDVILATLLKNNYYMFTPKYLLQFSMTDYLMDTSLSR